jgi:hypothetical protein
MAKIVIDEAHEYIKRCNERFAMYDKFKENP